MAGFRKCVKQFDKKRSIFPLTDLLQTMSRVDVFCSEFWHCFLGMLLSSASWNLFQQKGAWFLKIMLKNLFVIAKFSTSQALSLNSSTYMLLFRKRRFVLKEMFQWNTIFHISENQLILFHFTFYATLFFPLWMLWPMLTLLT